MNIDFILVRIAAMVLMAVVLLQCACSAHATDFRSESKVQRSWKKDGFNMDLAERADGPPERPKNFNNMEEVQNYLAALSDYYSVISRPRFGRNIWNYRQAGHYSNGNEKKFEEDLRHL